MVQEPLSSPCSISILILASCFGKIAEGLPRTGV